MQATRPHALRKTARRQTGVIAKHPQEVEARVTRSFRQNLQRRHVLAGFYAGAGVTHDLPGDGGAFAFRVAALAGAEPGGLGFGRRVEEPRILA